jgi:hypothetical protein
MLLSLTSALLAGGLVYGIYLLQLRQVQLQQTVDVVVPKDYISAGTMLTDNLLEYRPMYKGAVDPQMVTRIEDVVGLETVVPLGTKEPLLDWKLDRLRLFPREGQSTFQIPRPYILSISNGVRAGDRVRIYASGGGDANGGSPLFAHDIAVASVKTANNAEVDSPKHSTLLSKAHGDQEKMYISRLETSGAIEQVNLNLTEEEWLRIDRLCGKGGAKLVIAFTVAANEG